MTTERLSVGVKRVNWTDGQRVTKNDIQADQSRNVDIDAANQNNFFGSGVLLNSAIPDVIFDTNDLTAAQQVLLDGYSFDGQNILSATVDTSDPIDGVLLAVTLSEINVFGGSEFTRVCIIGDTFGGDLIHDDLTFYENSTQITRGRYASIRAILFNNFAGNLQGSRSLAVDAYDNTLIGRCVIREVTSMELSYDSIIAQQTNQPNKYFEDFYPAILANTVSDMLQDAIGADKSLSDLNIGIGSLSQRAIEQDDVTTEIGQKFLATGTNIQKVSMLVAVQFDSTVPLADAYDWSGSIVLTLRKLQTEVQCPITPTPDNAVDFDPDPAIIAQAVLDKDSLEEQGIVLDGYSRIVDFVFTDNTIADPVRSPLELNTYYVITISRTGDTSVGVLLFEEAPHRAENGYMVVYNGSQWINVTESDMWFCIYGDYVKVSDGVSYENGVGVQIPKIAPDETNTEVPYIDGLIPFYTTARNVYNYMLLEETDLYSDPQQDQRTGNYVETRVMPSPVISAITSSSLTTLLETNSAPVLLAKTTDTNPRGNPATITGTSVLAGVARGTVFNIFNPDADLLSFNLIRSLITPNTNTSNRYRISEVELFTDSYGDLNGDGIIDAYDLLLMSQWVAAGYFINPITSATTQNNILAGHATIEAVRRADLNGDGLVNADDVILLTNYLAGTISSFPVGSTFTRMQLTVENVLNPLTTTPDIDGSDSEFTTTPVASLIFEINSVKTWYPDYLEIIDLRRYLPTTFIEPVSPNLETGRNDFYIPGNLIIEGYQVNPNNTSYSVDLEINHIVLDIPILDSLSNPTFIDGYTAIDLAEVFVEETSLGLTANHFKAMKYADGSYVQIGDFEAGKVKMVPTLMSNSNSYSSTPIEDIVGIYYDPTTSIMTMYMKNLYDDSYGNLHLPKKPRISITVYLKKAGFINTDRHITEAEVRDLFGI